MRRVVYKNNMGKLDKIIKRGLRYKLVAVKGILESYLDQKLEGDAGRTGRQYVRPDGTPYTASAPGEWPSEKSGDLRNSIGFDIKVTNSEVSLAMTAGVPYATDLEIFMSRPFFLRAVSENMDEIHDILFSRI